MKLSKQTFWNIILLIEIIFVIKAGLSLFRVGPFIFSDESCIIQKAIFFAENFNLKTCEELTILPAGNPQPLYSILLAPIYHFFSGLKAYHIALVLNSLMISSLVYPLFGIFKKFIKKNSIIYALSIGIIFLPHIGILEQTVMTESLFTTLSIWGLYFYINSFKEDSDDHKRNKIIAIILALLGTFTRPFGFIIPLAIVINEIVLIKKTRKTLILVTIAFIVSLAATGIFILKNQQVSYFKIFVEIITVQENFLLFLKAVWKQFSSLIISTLFLPFVIFTDSILKKDSDSKLKNIKIFLLSAIILNFIISAQHLYGYLIKDVDPGLITRYIIISAIYIFIFSGVYFFGKKTDVNKKTIVIALIALIGLFTFNDEFIKHTLNFDLAGYFNFKKHLFNRDLIVSKKILSTIIFPLLLISCIFYLFKQKKITTYIFIIVFGLHLILSNMWIIGIGTINPLVKILEGKETNIAFIKNPTDGSFKESLNMMWGLMALTKNNVKMINAIPPKDRFNELTPEDLQNSEHYKNAEYILTKLIIKDLDLKYTINDINLYKKELDENKK